jgi:hypothetical protein
MKARHLILGFTALLIVGCWSPDVELVTSEDGNTYLVDGGDVLWLDGAEATPVRRPGPDFSPIMKTFSDSLKQFDISYTVKLKAFDSEDVRYILRVNTDDSSGIYSGPRECWGPGSANPDVARFMLGLEDGDGFELGDIDVSPNTQRTNHSNLDGEISGFSVKGSVFLSIAELEEVAGTSTTWRECP